MPRLLADAEVVKRDPAYVADENELGVLTIRRMRDSGLLDQVEEHFPIARPRGHGALARTEALQDGGARPWREIRDPVVGNGRDEPADFLGAERP